MEWLRGKNTPDYAYPNPPLFGEPCKAASEGAWRNLGGHWIRDRYRSHAIRSYQAVYYAVAPRKALLGGVPRARSCRYQTKDQAQAYLTQSMDANGEGCDGVVVERGRPPEIFIHCGTVVTCIGAKCPGCGRELTRADAETMAERN